VNDTAMLKPDCECGCTNPQPQEKKVPCGAQGDE